MTDRTIIANRPANSFARNVVFADASGERVTVSLSYEGGTYAAGESRHVRQDGMRFPMTPVNPVKGYADRERARQRFNQCCAIWENHPDFVTLGVTDYIPA